MTFDYKPPKLPYLGYYILDEQNRPVQEPDLLKWGQWFQDNRRHTACDMVNDVRVSTIFLGLDHSFMNDTPILWETMIFGGEFDQYQERYYCHEDALSGHQRSVDKVRGIRLVAK